MPVSETFDINCFYSLKANIYNETKKSLYFKKEKFDLNVISICLH